MERRKDTEAKGRVTVQEIRERTRIMEGATTLELVVAAAAVGLAIVGLAGVLPRHMAAAAAILIGGGLMMEGAAIAARYRELLTSQADTPPWTSAALSTTVETLGGVGIVVLGILAVIGLYPVTLLAVSALAFGATLWFGAPEVNALGAFADRPGPDAPVEAHARHQAARASAAASALAGMAVGVLGILVLAQIGQMKLILSAMIVAGGATLVRGGFFTTRVVRLARQTWPGSTPHRRGA